MLAVALLLCGPLLAQKPAARAPVDHLQQGRRLTLNPFAILLGLTFWAFLWGPIGAFLSVPFLITGLAIRDRVMPDETPELPA